MRIDNIWEQALSILKKEVTDVSYDLWLTKLSPVDFKNGIFYLSITSESAKQRILKLHGFQIKTTLKRLSCEIEDFYILDPIEANKFKNDADAKELTETKSAFVSTFNSKYTFESFVVGNSNKYVYAAAKGVADNPSAKINPLFIYGGVGLGKTHLLHAIGNHLKEIKPELKVLYVTCDRFTNDYVDCLTKGDVDTSKFRAKYRSVDVLMIDDIQFLSKKPSTQEALFHTFNDLYQNNKQIILASDRPPAEIATLEERLRSRFSMGLIQDVQTPDFETRMAILQKKASQEKYSVDDDVITYIAENCDTNIREMEGILSKVCFYSSLLNNNRASMKELKEALKDHISTTKQNITPDKILSCVSKYFSVSKEDLIGKKKTKEIVEPRQICMYIIYEMMDLPLTSIGQIFNGRDHTTVIHAREKINRLIKENNRIKIAVSDIKNMVNYDK